MKRGQGRCDPVGGEYHEVTLSVSSRLLKRTRDRRCTDIYLGTWAVIQALQFGSELRGNRLTKRALLTSEHHAECAQ